MVIGLGLSLLVIGVTGSSVSQTASAFLTGSFGNGSAVAATVGRAGPLVMIALSWIVAIRSGLFNIGQSGQLLIGGLCATVAALYFHLPVGLALVAAVVAAVVGGALWAGHAAVLSQHFEVNEIVSTLLLSLIAAQVVAWLDRGPLKQGGQPLPQSAPIGQGAQWPQLVHSTGLDFDIFVVLVVMVAIQVLLKRTTFGMRMRYVTANEHAARIAGIRVNRVRFWAFLLSGALAGFVGASLIVGGQTHIFSDGFDSNLGIKGIVVALIAMESPIGCVPAALLIAALHQGGGYVQAVVGVSSDMVLLTEGIVVILVAGSAFVVQRFRTERVDAERSEDGTEPEPVPAQIAPDRAPTLDGPRVPGDEVVQST